jgi:hypothetical protein
MPFAGDLVAARGAVATLLALDPQPGDELILADNSGTAELTVPPRVTVVRATGEASPAHARNLGAERARRDWILFLDADCVAPPGLLDAYFAEGVAAKTGALAGEVVPAAEGADSLAARYGTAKSFLSQERHIAHPYRPRAVAANLLVRRSAFEQIGGFYEGVRAAEDTDFSWRLQAAGWRLELRADARVEHRYRATVGELRRQWRGYAAGRAWLARRYDGFEPEPALRRVVARRRGAGGPKAPTTSERSRLDRAAFAALDALLGVEELVGLALSNRPASDRPAADPAVEVVLVAGRFPAPDDPLVDFARALEAVRVEAAARPGAALAQATRTLRIDYREDEGAAARAGALLMLVALHPLRSALDLARRSSGDPPLLALAPAVRRLEHDPRARVHALGGDEPQRTARRLAALAGRGLQEPRRS